MNNTERYTDIHAHILPGVDDGSENMEETLQMLKLALEQNIRTIIATPHYVVGSENTPTDKLLSILGEVQSEAAKLDKDLIIYPGNELLYSESIIDELKSKAALTLAQSRYVLVEFLTTETYTDIYRGMSRLLQSGYAPILAHAERYRCLYRREDLIGELIKAGCYIQMNGSSLTGGILNSEAVRNRKLFYQGLVHFVGSDCHDARIRVPVMENVVKTLQKKSDEGLIDRIFKCNPMNVLKNTYI